MNAKIILLATTLASCALDTDDPAPFATLAATDGVTSKLGVTTWEVTRVDADVRIIGRDSSANRNVEMIVQRDERTPEDRVRIEVVFPETTTFELTSSGELEGALSELAVPLGNAVQSDLAHRTTPLAAPRDGYGTASSEVGTHIFMHANLDLGWSLFGYSGYADVSAWCPGQRRSEESRTWVFYGMARCSLDWLSPIPSDCRGRVYYSIGGDHWDTCHWDIIVEN